MKVLITGGAGFIGSNLARYFNRYDQSCEIRIIDDLSNGSRENLNGVKAQFIEASILDMDELRAVAEGVDAVVHLAALGSVPRSIANPRRTHEVNTTGTLNVLEASREFGVDHVIVASSSSVYGANPSLPKSEFDWTRPLSPYAVSKLATESYAIAYNYSFGLKTLAFRFFNVFGPYQPAGHVYAAVIPRFLDAALSGRPLIVHGDGFQSRDFTYVDTVCSAIFLAVQSQLTAGDPINLAFGTSTNLIDVVGKIETLIGSRVAIEHVESRTGDVRASQSDGVRIRELLPGVEPVPFDVGLANTIAWFRSKQNSA